MQKNDDLGTIRLATIMTVDLHSFPL
uniref:Uncharacterized protein n=1 Tax=Arundo donax TaxID=35708 RepID=A0A0A9DAY1_ARUDO